MFMIKKIIMFLSIGFIHNLYAMRKEQINNKNKNQYDIESVKISKHAKLRMMQRGFTNENIGQILNHGTKKLTAESNLIHKHNNKVVITDSLVKNIITVYENKINKSKNAWQLLTHNEREKIKLKLTWSNYEGQDLIAHFYKLCNKSRDIAKKRARVKKYN